MSPYLIYTPHEMRDSASPLNDLLVSANGRSSISLEVTSQGRHLLDGAS